MTKTTATRTFRPVKRTAQRAARILNDPSLSQVQRFTRIVSMIPSGREVMGEDLRIFVTNYGFVENNNARWGSFTQAALNEKLIEATNEFRAPSSPSSHGSKKAVYRRT
jgi:hypothetical protein